MRLDLVDEGFEFFRRNVFDNLGDEFDAVDGFEFVRIVGGLVADEFLFQVENLRLKLFLFFFLYEFLFFKIFYRLVIQNSS